MIVKGKVEIADIFGVSTKTIHNWMHEERVPFPNEGKTGAGETNAIAYDTVKCIEWYLQKKAGNFKDGNTEYIDPNYEKARLDKERADQVALQNEIKRQEVIPADVLQDSLEHIAEVIVSRLDSIPSKLAMQTNLNKKEIAVVEEVLADVRSGIASTELTFVSAEMDVERSDQEGVIDSKD